MGAPVTAGRPCSRQAALFPTRNLGLHAMRVGLRRSKAPIQVLSETVDREPVPFITAPRFDAFCGTRTKGRQTGLAVTAPLISTSMPAAL